MDSGKEHINKANVDGGTGNRSGSARPTGPGPGDGNGGAYGNGPGSGDGSGSNGKIPGGGGSGGNQPPGRDRMQGHGNGNGQGRRRRRWPWITVAILLVMMLAVRLSLRSAFVLNTLKHQIESAAAGQLNGELRIGNLTGDLWSHLELTGILLTLDDGSEILSTDTLFVSYSPLALIRRTVRINELRISHPVVRLLQDDDETWNVLRLLPEADPVPEDEETGDLPVRIELNRFELSGGEIHLRSAALLPDTSMRVDRLDIHADGSIDGDSFSARLHRLSLQVHEGRLAEPVRFETGFTADENTLTLEKLVLATGRTLIEGRGQAATDGDEIEFVVESEPVSWKDIRAYAEEAPIAGDLRMGLEVSGNLKQLLVGLNASAGGLEQFSLYADLSLAGDPSLTGLRLHIGGFNGEQLTGEAVFPNFSELSLNVEGMVAFSSHEEADLRMSGHLSGFRAGDIAVDRIGWEGTFEQQQLSLETVVQAGRQRVDVAATAGDLFGEKPRWEAGIRYRDIDPAWWTGDAELAGTLTGTLHLAGRGFEPGEDPWTYDLSMPSADVSGYTFKDFRVAGYLNRDLATADLGMRMAGGTIRLNGDFEWPSDNPAYHLSLGIASLNIGMLPGLEALDSNLNLHIEGSGRGLDPGTLTLDAEAGLQPSMVNGIRIERLTAPVVVTGGFVTIDRADLVTDLADGTLTVLQRVDDLAHPDNRVDFDLLLKDAGLLAGFTDMDILHARGGFSGTLRTIDGFPHIQTQLDLTDLRADTLSAAAIRGTLTAVVADSIPFSVDAIIEKPAVGKRSLQTISLRTDGYTTGDITRGDYTLGLITDEGSGLRTRASYLAAPDSIIVTTSELSLSDPDRSLGLEEAFSLRYIGGLVSMDTLRLVSTDGAMLHMHFLQYAEDAYSGMFRGRDVNLGNLQKSLLGEAIFDGNYDGNLEFDIRNERLFVHVDALVSGFSFNGLELDSIDVNLDIDQERMIATLRLTDPAGELIAGELDVPFIAADPATLDDDFFMEPVSGSLRFNESSLERFSGLLEYYGFSGLAGFIGMNAGLSGKAGEPVFDGYGYMRQARISNVDVDSSLIRWNYNHEKGHLAFDGFMKSLGQRAAEIRGTIPFLLDMRSFEIVEPGEDEQVDLRLITDGFNIAAFNEFLDPTVVRSLRGRLHTHFTIAGTVQDPLINGELRLENGSATLVENNITLGNILTDIRFSPTQVTINRMSAESAGSFDLTGTIALNRFEPGELDLRAVARNFRVFNTRDLNALITTDTRLTGDMMNPEVRGELRIERGHLYLDNFGERPIEEIVLEDEEPADDLFNRIFENMAIEYNLLIDRRFWVRNRSRPEMALELQGSIDAVKYPGEEIQLFGTMGTFQGYAQQLGRRFELERGDINFSGQAGNPELNIRTLYRIRKPEDIRIWYEIGGTVEEPTFAWSSDPEMELPDILSYTLFGRPFHALQGWERTVAGGAGEGTSAADMAFDILMDRVEMLAADRLGVDVIEIDNTRQGGSSGITVKAGKYMTDRLFLAILQELGGSSNSQFIIEYLLTRNLELIVTGDNDYRTGVDLLWRLEY